MVCKLDANDFRAARYVLEPDDFALSDGPDRPPTDLIDETAWRGIMDLPSDVAIRTTSYQGTRAAYCTIFLPHGSRLCLRNSTLLPMEC
jgi:hypothetical protein